ncbi:MAG: hypothetical protein IAG13_08785, partial [Deltaproteobacteria bacterium]|nr:hypothetical protein [Nannocystaceae bacterium]
MNDDTSITTAGRAEAVGLRRELGLFDTVAVVVGACVGVGIFFTPARVAALAGSVELALWAWVAGGWWDRIVTRLSDTIMAFPLFVLAMGI